MCSLGSEVGRYLTRLVNHPVGVVGLVEILLAWPVTRKGWGDLQIDMQLEGCLAISILPCELKRPRVCEIPHKSVGFRYLQSIMSVARNQFLHLWDQIGHFCQAIQASIKYCKERTFFDFIIALIIQHRLVKLFVL